MLNNNAYAIALLLKHGRICFCVHAHLPSQQTLQANPETINKVGAVYKCAQVQDCTGAELHVPFNTERRALVCIAGCLFEGIAASAGREPPLNRKAPKSSRRARFGKRTSSLGLSSASSICNYGLRDKVSDQYR